LTAPHPDRGWALVTGAARRIGRALALAAAKAGFDVVVHYGASKSDAAETVRLITQLGRRARSAAADLRDPTSAGALIGAAEGPLTLLVNSASIFEDDKIETVSAESLDAHRAVNLRAPVTLARAFAEALPSDRSGLIVNILDQRVWRLTPQFFSYTLSKAALWTATRTMAQALGPRIRVNAIGPGPTLPSIHQSAAQFAAEGAASLLGRGPTPEDVAAALTYLIDASSVTGQKIAVDGGQHLAWRTPDVIAD
jgi:NAD(P)-dependent dehydrogenase (short-subunit alcohol dehydrogenase family)